MKSRTQLSTVTCNLYWAMHLGLSTRLYLWYISDTSHWKWAGPSLHCLSPNDTSLEPSWESHTQDGKPDSISVSSDSTILFSGSSLDRELAEWAGSCQQNQPLRNHSSKRESWNLGSESDDDRTEPESRACLQSAWMWDVELRKVAGRDRERRGWKKALKILLWSPCLHHTSQEPEDNPWPPTPHRNWLQDAGAYCLRSLGCWGGATIWAEETLVVGSGIKAA